MELISQAEYARRKKVSRAYIGKLVKKGTITLVKGKIDPKQADRQIEQSADPARVHVNSKNQKSEKQPDTYEKVITVPDKSINNVHQTFLKARAKKEIIRAEKEQFELEELRKKYVQVEKVGEELEKVVMAIRSTMLSLPTKLAKEVKNTQNLLDIQEVLERGIYECLTELSDLTTNDNR